jgi:cellulose biosynthesis protein BcsQ
VLEDQSVEALETAIATLAADADVLVIDTPGRDDPVARAAILKADTLVTPMNDSFVDLDLIGQVNPDTFKVTKPSFYAELIWNSRTQRAKSAGKSVDWVVLRNRLQHIGSHNQQRVGAAMDELARRVGFRVIPGLSERVIYRELFPKGPDPARPQADRRRRHRAHRRAAGIAGDGGRLRLPGRKQPRRPDRPALTKGGARARNLLTCSTFGTRNDP